MRQYIDEFCGNIIKEGFSETNIKFSQHSFDERYFIKADSPVFYTVSITSDEFIDFDLYINEKCDFSEKIYGFLNRNIPEQQELLISLREKADIFILPTQAECAGIVFCESSAYGIPSITYDTGGIGDYVINGENGYRLPIGASGKEFARVIMDLVNSPGKLNEMRKNAKEMYSKELNWILYTAF